MNSKENLINNRALISHDHVVEKVVVKDELKKRFATGKAALPSRSSGSTLSSRSSVKSKPSLTNGAAKPLFRSIFRSATKQEFSEEDKKVFQGRKLDFHALQEAKKEEQYKRRQSLMQRGKVWGAQRDVMVRLQQEKVEEEHSYFESRTENREAILQYHRKMKRDDRKSLALRFQAWHEHRLIDEAEKQKELEHSHGLAEHARTLHHNLEESKRPFRARKAHVSVQTCHAPMVERKARSGSINTVDSLSMEPSTPALASVFIFTWIDLDCLDSCHHLFLAIGAPFSGRGRGKPGADLLQSD